MKPEHQMKFEEVIEKSEAVVRKTGEWVKGIIQHRQKNIGNNNGSNATNETAQELKSASTVIGAHRSGFFQQNSDNTVENLSAIGERCDKTEKTVEQLKHTLVNERELITTPTPGYGTATTGER